MNGRTYDDSMFRDSFEHGYTWLNGFLRNTRRFAERPALIDPETTLRWSYRELNEQANALAHALIQSGVGQGDAVMLVMRNCPAFGVAYIAARKAGAVFFPANFRLSAGELALLMEHNKPKVVLYSQDAKEIVVRSQELSSWNPVLFVMADCIEGSLKECDLPEGHVLYDTYVRGKPACDPVLTFRPHIYDEVVRFCTSGTTSLPKSVPINDINEVLSAHDVIMQYPLNCNDVTMNMTPWFHRGGLHSGGLCPVFYVGACVVVMRKFDPYKALQWLTEYGITFLMGAPTNVEMLCRVQEKESLDLSSLRGIVTMGSALLKDDCLRYMNVLTPNIFNGYGTTETFWNSFLSPRDLPEGAGSAGKSCIDDEVRVVKLYPDKKAEPEEIVPRDGVSEGEIIIFPPEKTAYSYFGDKSLQKEKFYKGWIYTGDTGSWAQDFSMTIKGRKDDMILVSGECIYPLQIEEEICKSDLVGDCLVTSVPDSARGNVLVAYAVPADGCKETLSVDYLRDFTAKSNMLSSYKRPRYFCIVDSLPMTATGKKKHAEMKARALEDLKNGLLKRF